MITLITGLPGNGKTLFALWFIKAMAEKDQREVYYHNIKDLKLPWTECDPEKWMDLPDGSVIVLDEAQFTFAKKPNGAKLPDFYEKLAVHRHSGKDLFLITQHPSLLDNFVRQLVGRHFHVIRRFGLSRATVYEWSAANPAPQNATSHRNAVTQSFSYPKEVYDYYKSAEVHTVKRAIPWKLTAAVIFAVAMPIVFFTNFGPSRSLKVDPKAATATASANAPGGVSGGSSQSPPGEAFDPIADARNYVAMNTPRVEGLPQTAPKYDDMTKPTSVPVPAMCIRRGARCQCYSQQATKINLSFNQCVDIAYNGYFQDFDPDPNRRQTPAVSQQSNQTDTSISSGANVMAFNHVQPAMITSVSAPEDRVQQARRAFVRN